MKALLGALDCRPGIRSALRTRLTAASLALAFILGFALSSSAVDPPASARTFDSLTVAGTTYTRVTIVDVAKRHVSFRSAQGFATVRLADLDSEVQSRLLGGSPEVSTATAEPRSSDAASEKTRRPVKVHARGTSESEPDEDCDEDGDETVSAPRIQWTARNIIGVGILGLGALAVCIGHIWFICAGFHTSVLWGLILLFGSIVADIMFCVGHWDAARRPTYLQMAGLALIVGGWKVFAH